MDHLSGLGARSSVGLTRHASRDGTIELTPGARSTHVRSNIATPRLASSSKDATVRVWNSKTRRLEFSLGSHTASVNVVRWGGEGVIYTASSDRTVKLWSGADVGLFW
jgi:WD40 repeat protein